MQENLNKIDEYIWEISPNEDNKMKVPARVYLSEQMLENFFKDKSLRQLMNTAQLPGVRGCTLAMPDVHEGYGFPIGGVAAFDYDEGIISPGGIGYDINCGVRVLKSNLEYKEIKSNIEKLSHSLYKNVPSGVGKSGFIKLNKEEMNKVLAYGCSWTDEQGYNYNEDNEVIESMGRLEYANPDNISTEALARGKDQLGTLGSGNHFIEVNYVSEIFDEAAANAYGLFKNQIVIQIHTGSRGLGHQIATDYVKIMQAAAKKYEIELPDRELACAPINSEEGKNYLAAMSCGANFAWANRQLISYQVRNAFKEVLGKSNSELHLLYDVAHNIAKVEHHEVNGQSSKLLVHRKGATRAFGPDSSEIPNKYKKIGQPVLIPGSMGTASYILAGTARAMQDTFGSACHGAGRLMSRTAAKRNINSKELVAELKEKGITVQTHSFNALSEEAPQAYKNVNQVIETIHNSGISRRVAKLKPIAVIKG